MRKWLVRVNSDETGSCKVRRLFLVSILSVCLHAHFPIRVFWFDPSYVGFVLFFLTVHIAHHFPIHNQRANTSTQIYGESILNSLPVPSTYQLPDGSSVRGRSALVLVNGDINNNLVKYPQQCDGLRLNDVAVMSMQLMTWDWFVPMQAHHYTVAPHSVVFPGNRYHPRIPGAFSLRQFLDANTKPTKITVGVDPKTGKPKRKKIPAPPVFICGPFKEGDDSHQVGYEIVPYGLCSQFVKLKHKKAKKQNTAEAIAAWNNTGTAIGVPPSPSSYREIKHWAQFLSDGLDALPDLKYPVWREWKYGAETWEHVVYHDSWSRLVYISSYISFHANQDLSDVAVLNVSKRCFDRIFGDPMAQLNLLERSGVQAVQPVGAVIAPAEYDQRLIWTSLYGWEPVFTHYRILRPDDFRAAGIIYGQYSKMLQDQKPHAQWQTEFRAVERAMYRVWTRFAAAKSDDKEIGPFVRDYINPYAGGKMHFAPAASTPTATAVKVPANADATASSSAKQQQQEKTSKKSSKSKSKSKRS